MLAAALAGTPPSPAAAAPAWLHPVDLSEAGQNAEAPQVALDAAGDATAVWSRSDGSHLIVQAALRPAGGSWSTPVDLSEAGQSAESPQLAVDASGEATAVWSRSDGSHSIVEAAVRPAGGSWGTPVDLSTAGRDAEAPQVALDAAGDATAVWSRFDGSNFIVQAAVRPADGSWSSPVDLSEAGQNAEAPQVALDPSGDATAVWSRFNGAKPAPKSVIQAASRVAGGGWAAAVDVSDPSQNAEAPQVGVDSVGTATAVWARSNGSNLIVQAADRPPGAAWSTPVDLSGLGRSATAPQLAIDPSGDAVAVWSCESGAGTTIVQAASRAPGGAWAAPAEVSAAGGVASAPQVAINAAGMAAAVWSFSNATPTVVSGSTRVAGGAWQPPVVLSALGVTAAQPEVGLDGEGNGLAAWSLQEASGLVVQAAGLDDAPPQPRSLSIPSAATIRLPATFSVAPFDVWSSVGPVTWSFDDGSTATGATVTHTFSSLGAHTATVVTGDLLGNLVSTGGTVMVFPGARAGRNALLRRRSAQLRLRCPSPAGCKGKVRLIAVARFERAGHAVGRRVAIGAAAFEIPGQETTTVPVGLSAKGAALVRGAGRKGLKAQLTGPGVKHRLVVLRASSGAS